MKFVECPSNCEHDAPPRCRIFARADVITSPLFHLTVLSRSGGELLVLYIHMRSKRPRVRALQSLHARALKKNAKAPRAPASAWPAQDFSALVSSNGRWFSR